MAHDQVGAMGHTCTVLQLLHNYARSAVSLFTEHKVREHEKLGQESLTDAMLSVNLSTLNHIGDTLRMPPPGPQAALLCCTMDLAVKLGSTVS